MSKKDMALLYFQKPMVEVVMTMDILFNKLWMMGILLQEKQSLMEMVILMYG